MEEKKKKKEERKKSISHMKGAPTTVEKIKRKIKKYVKRKASGGTINANGRVQTGGVKDFQLTGRTHKK